MPMFGELQGMVVEFAGFGVLCMDHEPATLPFMQPESSLVMGNFSSEHQQTLSPAVSHLSQVPSAFGELCLRELTTTFPSSSL